MKVPHIVLSLIAAIPAANAATVLTNYNLNTFLTTGAGKDGGSKQFTVNDGSGNTVTINIAATLAGGKTFTSLFGVPNTPNDNIGVETPPTLGDGERNHWTNSEDVTFTVSLISVSGNVDLSSIGFNFGSIGYRPITAGPTLSWAVNGGALAGGTTTSIPTSGAADANYNLDTAGVFTSLSAPYTGVLHTSATGVGQLSAVPSAASGGGSGMNFSVNFGVIPEPSAALLGGLGLLALLRRRR